MTTQYMIPDLIDQTGFEQSFEHRDENQDGELSFKEIVKAYYLLIFNRDALASLNQLRIEHGVNPVNKD